MPGAGDCFAESFSLLYANVEVVVRAVVGWVDDGEGEGGGYGSLPVWFCSRSRGGVDVDRSAGGGRVGVLVWCVALCFTLVDVDVDVVEFVEVRWVDYGKCERSRELRFCLWSARRGGHCRGIGSVVVGCTARDEPNWLPGCVCPR